MTATSEALLIDKDELRRPATEESLLLAEAARSDPFDLNSQVRLLPEMIRGHDGAALVRPLREIGGLAMQGEEAMLDTLSSREQLVAAIRDFGMFAGPAQRIYGEKRPLLVEIPGAMLAMQIITGAIKSRHPDHHGASRIPRDTFSDYLAQDPHRNGRLFTDTLDERIFVENLQWSYFAMDRANEILAGADFENESVDILIARLEVARLAFEVMREAQETVNGGVRDDVFNNLIQPNYPKLAVAGIEHYGPGGAQHVVLPVDDMLSMYEARHNPPYAEHRLNNMPYTTIHQQRVHADFIGRNGRSFADYIMCTDTNLTVGERNRLRFQLIRVLSSEDGWRGSHYKKAHDGFEGRDEDAEGSGGGTPKVLLSLHRQHQLLSNGLRVDMHEAATVRRRGRTGPLIWTWQGIPGEYRSTGDLYRRSSIEQVEDPEEVTAFLQAHGMWR